MRMVFRGNKQIGIRGGVALLSLLLASGIWAPRCAGFPASPQAEPDVGYKTLQVGGGGIRDALYITKVTVGDRQMLLGVPLRRPLGPNLILPGRPFQAGGDWLKSMTIYLKNRTSKIIAYVYIPLGFPETGNGRTEPQSVYDVRLGRMPATDAFSGRTGKPLRIDPRSKPLSLGPGQTLVIRVGDYIDQIKAKVEHVMPLMNVTKCVIYGTKGCFTDGMCWSGDTFSVPDMSHPGTFKYLSPNYFPGDPHEYWPPGQ